MAIQQVNIKNKRARFEYEIIDTVLVHVHPDALQISFEQDVRIEVGVDDIRGLGMRHSSCGGSRTQIAKKAFVFH